MDSVAVRPLAERFPRLRGGGQLGQRSVEELDDLLTRVRAFADVHVRPRALELDERASLDPRHFDWELVRAGAARGLLRLLVPAQAGGLGGGAVECSLVMEELCAACPGIANIFGVQALGVAPVLVLGGAAHWDGLLREITESERDVHPQLMAFAITEPGAGTDAEDADLMRRGSIATRARRVAGGYALSGTKHFISNGSVARWISVAMPTDPRRPAETLTWFVVDSTSPGFAVGHVEHKLGQRACPAAELVFDEVVVPDELVLGREGDGIAGTLMVLATSRAPVGAIATGIARGAYERLSVWLHQASEAEGLLELQHVQLVLARMEEEIHLARQAYMDAATELDRVALGPILRHPLVRGAGMVPRRVRSSSIVRRRLASAGARDATVALMRRATGDAELTRAFGLSSMAKARGSDVAMWVTDAALELAGLQAGAVRPQLEKLWRDAKLTQIYEGTNQLNRVEVHRALCEQEELPMLPAAHALVGAGAGR